MKQPKLIYLAQRPLNRSRRQFIDRWRQHGGLAMAQPRWINMARYVQCDAVAASDIPDVSEDHDGVGILWFRSEAHLKARDDAGDSTTIMKADELETFRGPVTSVQFFAERGPDASCRTELTLFRFVWRAPALPAAEFSDRWKAEEAARVSVVGDLARSCVVNDPLVAIDSGGGMKCDVVEEYGFDNLPSLHTAQTRLSARGASEKSVAMVLTVATTVRSLYDRG